MKIYQIAFTMFLFNISLSMLVSIGFADIVKGSGLTKPLEGGFFSGSDTEAAIAKMNVSISQKQEGLASLAPNWLIESVRLVLDSISAFMKLISGATINIKGTLATAFGGVPAGSSLNGILNSIALIVNMIYLVGIIEIAAGRYLTPQQR